MKNKFGIFARKKEMTQVWLEDSFVPVTILHIPQQEVVRYKNEETDGYDASVVGMDKKSQKTKSGEKLKYSVLSEFPADSEFVQKYSAGSSVGVDVLEGVDLINLTSTSIGKGFQGGMKRFHLKGGNKTRGSKFHRWIGSMGNRKPRRTQKGHPHAGRMGGETVTLKNRPIVDRFEHDGENYIAVKGSVPGSYNALLKLLIS